MKKIIFIIYTVVIAVMGLCAIFLKEYLNILIDSLVPLGVCLVYFYFGCMLLGGHAYFWGGKMRYSFMRRVRGDFKYSKDKRGKGSFEKVSSDIEVEAHKSITNIIAGYLFLVSAASAIPFIFFFSLYTKWWSSIAIFFASYLSAVAVNAVVDIIMSKNARKAEREREAAWQRELEEQKKREEMGRWR